MYDVDEPTRNQLTILCPDISILHTPTLKDMEPFIEEADVIVSLNFSDELVKRAKKLKWFQAVGAGINHLLTPEFIKRGIMLTNTRGNHTIPVSEHAFALLLALTRRIYMCYGENNILDRWERVQGDELYGMTMGVFGVGNIGREIARKARAFGMKVRGYDEVPVFVPFLDGLYLQYQLEDFFSGLDVLVVAAALTAGSSGSVNKYLISLMNKGSYLINIARGPVVVEEDLIEALKSGHLTGAGLDVFRDEPLPLASELRRLPNVVLTPHIGGLNPRYASRVLQVFVENFRRWLNQEPLINVVDTSGAFWHDEGRK
jgi:phosphoglycerate dehydrogenase-like enzyme